MLHISPCKSVILPIYVLEISTVHDFLGFPEIIL
jgi:hypothetical protein